jgi:putative restriction endonuclease
MKMFVGVTDYDWYTTLKENKCDEVNFWTPGATNFKALSENDILLFKLHSPRNYIVGGGFFVRFSILPTYLAWSAFGIKNGTTSLQQLNERIIKYRSKIGASTENPQIGCIILTEPFFFEERDWIPAPDNWSNAIVRGKTYSDFDEYGIKLFQQVQERLQYKTPASQEENRYGVSTERHRLGQGAFRIIVTEAYQKRCAITGEKTLPVLEAAHIRPYTENGPHLVKNGLLLRSDFHTLFDDGYITITPDFHVEISNRLHSDYGNGRDYYKFQGSKLLILPQPQTDLPSSEYLEWHNNNVYLG